MKSIRGAASSGLAAMLCSAVTSAQTTFTTGESKDIRFQWGIPDEAARSRSGNVYFQLNAAESYTWVGLGIGSGMMGAEIFLFYQDGDGNVTLSTRDGVGEVMPEYSARPDVQLLEGSGVVDGRMIANVRCGDCASSLDLAGTNDWIVAWLSGDPLDSTNPREIISIHDEEAEFEVDFAQAVVPLDANPFSASQNNDISTGSGASEGGPDYDTVLLAHGIIMTIVFIALYPLGALLMPLLGKWLLHATFQMLAFLLMWAGFALGYIYANYDGYLWRTHTLVGAIVVSLLGLQPVLGWLHHRHFATHRRRGIISHIHIWYGRALMILGIINGGLGLQLAGLTSGSYVIAYCVVAGVMVAAYVGSVVFGLFRKRQGGTRETSASDSENTNRRSS